MPQQPKEKAGWRRAKGSPGEHAHHWLVRKNSAADKDVLLEEYKAIRAEITASIQAQISILAFGAASLGFSFAAASQTTNTSFRGMFLLVLVPLISYLILIVWFSEVTRMLRAGAFLMRLEKRLDEQFGHGALTWESTIFQIRCQTGPRAWLLDPDKFRMLAITLLFFTISGTSIAIGWDSVSFSSWQRWFALSALAVAVGVVAWLYKLRAEQVEQLVRPWLAHGRQGADVEELQKKLRRLGFYEGRVDGAFGDVTREAVVRLQRAQGLEEDGVVGLMTELALDALDERRRSARANGGEGGVVEGDAVAPERPAAL